MLLFVVYAVDRVPSDLVKVVDPLLADLVGVFGDYAHGENYYRAPLTIICGCSLPMLDQSILILTKLFSNLSELEGIASHFKKGGYNITLGDVVLVNLIYEITAGCTSIVADNGTNILHGRNLDYSLAGLSICHSHTLFVSFKDAFFLLQGLQNLTVNARYVRGGSEVYRGTTYVGYIGLLTGMRPGGWRFVFHALPTFTNCFPILEPVRLVVSL